MQPIRIKLLKDVKAKKRNEIAHATRKELDDLKLEAGKDYVVIGTPPTRVASDLDKPSPPEAAPPQDEQTQEAAEPAIPDPPPNTTNTGKSGKSGKNK